MTKQKKFITCDGNQAAAHISYTVNPDNACPLRITAAAGT